MNKTKFQFPYDLSSDAIVRLTDMLRERYVSLSEAIEKESPEIIEAEFANKDSELNKAFALWTYFDNLRMDIDFNEMLKQAEANRHYEFELKREQMELHNELISGPPTDIVSKLKNELNGNR